MSRSFPLLRTNLLAVKDAVTHGDAFLWMGWACLLTASLIGTAFYFLWKGLISPVAGNIIGVLPLHAGAGAQVTVNVCLGLCLLVILLCWAFSMCWVHADQMTYRSGDRERLLAKLIPTAGAVGRIIGIGLGIAVVGWVLDVAVAERLDGSLPHSQLIVLGAYGVLLAPLTVRLWYLPPIAAVENGNAAGPWAMLLQATNGRMVDMAATIVLQALLLAVSVYAFELLVADLAAPIWDVATAGGYTKASDWATAIHSQISPELLESFLVWAFISGPILMVVAAMQVSTIRFLVGVADEGVDARESHYTLTDAGQEKAEGKKGEGRSTPADPLRPQFARFEGPDAPAPEPGRSVIEESRELPDELLAAAQGEEASLGRLAPAPAPVAVGEVPPSGQFSIPAPPSEEPVPRLAPSSAPATQEEVLAGGQFSIPPSAFEEPVPRLEPPPRPQPSAQAVEPPPPAPQETVADTPPPPPADAAPFEVPPPSSDRRAENVSSSSDDPERPTLRPPVGGFDDEIGDLPSSPLDRFRKR